MGTDMSDKETLEKAIAKAVDGGWDFWGQINADGFEWHVDGGQFDQLSVMTLLGGGLFYHHPTSVIYDHDFVAAIWPEEMYINLAGEYNADNPEWKWHLQRMVVAEEALKYLADYL